MESSGQQFAVSIEISKIENRERNRIPVSESGSNWKEVGDAQSKPCDVTSPSPSFTTYYFD